MRKLLRRQVVVPVAAVLALLFAAALYWFQPWKLVVDKSVDEAVPTVVATAQPGTPVATEPVVLAEGTFRSHEHPTTGTVQILQLADGQRILRLENLDTSNGPLLKVLLSDQTVTDDWYGYDDGRFADLGELKGNQGNQNYEIPAGLDLAELPSVSIWCDRFDVSFGAATLTPV